MKTLKDLIQQRKDAQAKMGPRTSIYTMLFLLGLVLLSSIAFVLSFFPIFRFIPFMPWIILIFVGIFIFLFIRYAKKFSQNPKLELEGEKPSRKSLVGSVMLLMLLLVVIFFGFSFFITIAKEPWFTTTPSIELIHQNRFIGAQVIGMVIFFSATPFIIVLWYRTAPRTAVNFILKFHNLFYRKGKKKINEIIVLDMPQTHSATISVKRAVDALLFSLFTTFTIYLPFMGLLRDRAIPVWPIFQLISPGQVSTIKSLEFIQYCTSYLMNLVTPLIGSFVIFFWALPPTYLLDDAGVVFYRRFKNRRQPTEIKTISSWFLSMVKGIVGYGGLTSYGTFIYNNLGIVGIVANETNMVVATQFGLFILGMPFFGALLMAYFLMLFQENNFTKLKTSVYQKLVDANTDPRVVQIDLERKDRFQEPVLLNYYGENFFHDPPLRESIGKFGTPGIIDGTKDIPVPVVHREPVETVVEPTSEAGEPEVIDEGLKEPGPEYKEPGNFEDKT
ncbi:MAG: hypothetical protein ACFFCS_22420 [Candidatus Hodarchaeota archaeon]